MLKARSVQIYLDILDTPLCWLFFLFLFGWKRLLIQQGESLLRSTTRDQSLQKPNKAQCCSLDPYSCPLQPGNFLERPHLAKWWAIIKLPYTLERSKQKTKYQIHQEAYTSLDIQKSFPHDKSHCKELRIS